MLRFCEQELLAWARSGGHGSRAYRSKESRGGLVRYLGGLRWTPQWAEGCVYLCPRLRRSRGRFTLRFWRPLLAPFFLRKFIVNDPLTSDDSLVPRLIGGPVTDRGVRRDSLVNYPPPFGRFDLIDIEID